MTDFWKIDSVICTVYAATFNNPIRCHLLCMFVPVLFDSKCSSLSPGSATADSQHSGFLRTGTVATSRVGCFLLVHNLTCIL